MKANRLPECARESVADPTRLGFAWDGLAGTSTLSSAHGGTHMTPVPKDRDADAGLEDRHAE